MRVSRLIFCCLPEVPGYTIPIYPYPRLDVAFLRETAIEDEIRRYRTLTGLGGLGGVTSRTSRLTSPDTPERGKILDGRVSGRSDRFPTQFRRYEKSSRVCMRFTDFGGIVMYSRTLIKLAGLLLLTP